MKHASDFTVLGRDKALDVTTFLVRHSTSFVFTPLPFDHYRFGVDPDVAERLHVNYVQNPYREPTEGEGEAT